MFELTAATAERYLRDRGHVGPELVRVTELADGVSNAVLRVETADRVYVLKQSRPQLRTREAWFSDVGRIWRERDVMLLLRPLLPAGVVPEVLFSDEENFAFAMSHAPEPFRNWRSVLLGGEADPTLGELAGRLLGTIHQATADRLAALEPFRDRTVFEQLRIEPFYLCVQERLADVADAVAPSIDRMRSARLALCHGDFSPKNLLTHAAGFTLVDYETGHFGDPTMDLGFFLSHLLLKAIHLPAARAAITGLTRSFWRGYAIAACRTPLDDWQAAGIDHLGVCLLARVDGTSPAPYLTGDAERSAARRAGRRILREQPRLWDGVLEIVEECAVCAG
jgi:5-methylthioribose kinase